MVFKEYDRSWLREAGRPGLAAEAGVQRRAACEFDHVSSTVIDNLEVGDMRCLVVCAIRNVRHATKSPLGKDPGVLHCIELRLQPQPT